MAAAGPSLRPRCPPSPNARPLLLDPRHELAGDPAVGASGVADVAPGDAVRRHIATDDIQHRPLRYRLEPLAPLTCLRPEDQPGAVRETDLHALGGRGRLRRGDGRS